MVDEILTFEQVAELLEVSKNTLIRLLAEERIPARKVGRKWLFSREALIQWIAEGDSRQYARKNEQEEQ
ncbi:helix-turn-helix domain-containing protein [Alicyclobacillus cycloheptanicus]|uniref:helix-turn-helix domain-containing protein n=1 Tax=Alicyclobacillus cycloheptanicus TaxID=1457 RepID=UPI00390899B2